MARRRSPSAASVDTVTRPPAAANASAIRAASAAAPWVSLCASRNASPGAIVSSGVPASAVAPRYEATLASPAASMSSITAGRMRAAVTAADAAAAASTPGNAAATVTTSPGTTGRSRTVASTITPSVPSEPVISAVRSYPVTPFTVRCPVRRSRPSASTTASPSTASRVTPYFAHSRPPAFVAMLPPMDEMARLAGSGANQRPSGSECVVEVAVEHARLDDRELVGLRDLEDAVHPGDVEHDRAGARDGAAGEARARSRGTTGVPVAWAMRITACTSSTDAACTTAIGGVALRHPERSSRVASSAAGSVVTDAPRASCRRARTSVGIPPR